MMNNVEILVAAMHIQRLATSLNYTAGVLVGGLGDENLMSGAVGDSIIERIKGDIEAAQHAINSVNCEINNKNNKEVSE